MRQQITAQRVADQSEFEPIAVEKSVGPEADAAAPIIVFKPTIGSGRAAEQAILIDHYKPEWFVASDVRVVGEGVSEIKKTPGICAVIAHIHGEPDANLPKVAFALRRVSTCLGPRQRWQQQARQNRDNRDDHEQFDQSKSSLGASALI